MLGIDSVPRHSTLTTSAGTHFQFLHCDASDIDREKIAAACQERFEGRETLNVLICCKGHEAQAKGGSREVAFIEEVADVMGKQGGGIVLSVIGEGGMEDIGHAEKDEHRGSQLVSLRRTSVSLKLL